MDLATQRLMSGAAGASGDKVYVDDVFSTYIYNANQGNYINVNNGIDLAGEGGLVWGKRRDYPEDHVLCDTERGPLKYLSTSGTSAQNTSHGFSAYNSNGFTVNNASRGAVNQGSGVYCTWTFRKAPGFFDVVTYTGNGSNRTIAHSLGSVPGMILIRRYDGPGEWMVYHVGNIKAGNGSSITGHTAKLRMDDNSSASSSSSTFNNTAPTSSVFSLGTEEWVNENGYEFVAYIFGNNDQSFGVNGNDAIIKCGNWTGDNSYSKDITLGFEPQWLMVKNASDNTTWTITDNLRGIPNELAGKITQLAPSFIYSESQFDSNEGNMEINLHADGFTLKDNSSVWNSNNGNYIYVAIRRPDGFVGKPVEIGTDVFAMDGSGAGTPGPSFISNFPVDFALDRKPASSQNWYAAARLIEGKYLATNTTSDANTDAEVAFDYSNGFINGNFFGNSANQAWMWKRHAGFDVVMYEGDGSNSRFVRHSLGKVPEMIWIKRADSSGDWYIYHNRMRTYNGNDWSSGHFYMKLNAIDARVANSFFFMGGDGTTTTFELASATEINGSGKDFLTMLFASVEGVSKVGWYTGTGSDQTITTGFQPRFVFIKRADTGDYGFILDTTRGWASGNDNYLRIENNAAQASADFGNPVSTGFFVKGTSSGTNTNTGHYIYYAHA